MEFIQTQYSILGYTCKEYCSYNKKLKRVFIAKHKINNQIAKIVTYPISMVHDIQLCTYLNNLKRIQHPMFDKISQIINDTVLITQSPTIEKQKVIAVLFKNISSCNDLIHFYDFILDNGPFPQKIIQYFARQLWEAIVFFKSKNIINGFSIDDLNINAKTYRLHLDNLGDRTFFKSQQPTMKPQEQLGYLLFTMFYMFPPFTKELLNDQLLFLLRKGSNKYWQHVRLRYKEKSLYRGLISQISSQFKQVITTCFSDKSQQIKDNKWLTTSIVQQSNINQNIMECKVSRRQYLKDLQLARYDRKLKFCQAFKEKHNVGCQRSGFDHENQLLSLFIDKLIHQDNHPRFENQLQRKFVSYLLTLLQSDHKLYNLKILRINDCGNHTTFDMEYQWNQQNNPTSEVTLTLIPQLNITLKGTNNYFEQSFFRNYVQKLVTEATEAI